MDRRIPSDYDWSWWPGDPDSASPPQEDDEEEALTFLEEQPTTHLPARAAIVDELPVPSSARRAQAARRRRLARRLAPLLMLILVAAVVVVLLLPDASIQQPAIIQTGMSNVTANTPAPDIQAYIVGAVVHPGVYPLHSGDRVDTLLLAAGGALPNADLVRVNLAAHVSDGEEVYVPRVGEPMPSGLPGGGPGKVNINTASAEDMHNLLGISLTTANKIVAYREAHGPYTAIDQLLNVMSRTTYDKIKDFITV
jgi:competence protein ComEA